MSEMQSPPAADPADPLGDTSLAVRLQAGDATAFELVMRRHNRRLYRLARSMLRNDADAEDALQEAYFSAFRSMTTFRAESSLATWLSHIVVNECRQRLRRQARRDNIVPILSTDAAEQPEDQQMASADTETPDSALVRAQMRALLERKLDELPESFRTVFVLRCVEELSVEETARCLDIPEPTVRSRQFRARSMLRDALAQEMDVAQGDVFSFDGARCDRIVSSVLRRLASRAHYLGSIPASGPLVTK